MTGYRTMDETAFQNIIRSNADGIIVVDGEGSVILANPAAESLFGRPEVDLRGAPFGFPVMGGQTAEIEIFSAPGRGKSVEMRAVETSWQGKPAILVSMRDVTLRKLTEEALKESARFVRATLDAISSHVAVLDESGLIVTVNQAWRDFANANPPIMGNVSEGANYLAVCDRAIASGFEEAAVFAAGIRSVIAGEAESFEMEYPCHSPVEERWFVARVTRFPGEGPTRVVVLHTNITERKRAEDAVKRERDFASALLDTVGSLVVVLDRQGQIFRFNHTAERVTGYSAEEVTGKPFWNIFLLPEETEGVRVVYEQLTSGHFPNSHENHWITKEGDLRLISWSNTALLDPSGDVEFVIATGADITERKKADELREEYTSLISHDLRNPLSVVLGQASWLQRRLEEKGLTQEAKGSQQIVKGARRMNEMIQDLADSAKLESGTLRMDLEPTDFCQLALDLVERIPHPEGRNRLVVNCPTWVPPVMADPARTERAVENLVSNALKYSPEEAVVELQFERIDGQVVLSVEDHGAGVPPEDLPHLFDRFYRAGNVGRTKGLGLGLYITKLIAEAEGGRVWAESEEGKGSRFYLSLPVVPNEG